MRLHPLPEFRESLEARPSFGSIMRKANEGAASWNLGLVNTLYEYPRRNASLRSSARQFFSIPFIPALLAFLFMQSRNSNDSLCMSLRFIGYE